MSNNNSNHNSTDILSYNEYIPSSTKMNINRHLSLYSPTANAKNPNILNTYLNSNKLMKNENKNKSISKNTKRGKSVANNLSTNNPSTFESSFSNSIFDLKSPQLKNLNISGISYNKILVHLRPKSDHNKIKLDIILGYCYFLSKQKQNKKKIDKFIFKTQQKFDDKMKKFREKNSENILNSIKKSSLKQSVNINNNINQEIKLKTKIFHKFENLIAIFSLIMFYLIKINKKNEAKIIYLLIIKQNIKHMKYLESVINFNDLLNDKFGKYKIKMYGYANMVLLKVYSILIKYGFFFNLSLYGNLFMKIYLNFSQKYFIYSLSNQKIKYSPVENIKLAKNWFSYLNYYSAYFCLANYLPTKIPIYLYNSALSIINSIDERNYDLNDKNFILSAKYNKSLLLYIIGESEEAINTLKTLKINLFAYINDNYIETSKRKSTKSKSSFLSPQIAEQLHKRTGKSKETVNQNLAISFNKIFSQIIQGKNLKNNRSKQLFSINSKFEPYFISNIPINIEEFVNKYFDIYGISSNNNNQKEPIKQQLSFQSIIKKITKVNSNSSKKQSLPEINNTQKSDQLTIPRIFQHPILIRSELLIAEIELDRRHYRAAYTFTNHALAIISIFRKLQDSYLLNKYREEQKYIKEFLNIIDNSNMINDSDNEEEEEEKEKESNIAIKNPDNKEQIEFKERINLNKKMLKELEKFFIFFMNLSLYQITILNETQPKAEIKDYLPILFQNQFKDCLSLSQSISLENLDVMSLSRYMILKDPSKLILPGNLNISTEYFSKPELFGSRYIIPKRKIPEKDKKEEAELNKKANEIFRQVIKNINAQPRLVKLLKKNDDLVLKIIKNSNKKQIKNLIQNPEALIIPIEKCEFNRKNPHEFNMRGFQRQKSQIISNNVFSGLKAHTNKLNSGKDGRDLFHKSFQKKLHNDIGKIKSKHLQSRKSLDKSNFLSRNKLKLNSLIKKKKSTDSYSSSYKLSVVDNLSDSD